jgi:peptidyl-prolyl cis-trans isomerase B (cyclophilin B)
MKQVRVIGTAALLLSLTACSSNSTETAAPSTAGGPMAKLPVRATGFPPSVDCEYASSEGSAAKDVKKPGSAAITKGLVEVTLKFEDGPVTLELDPALSPCTVNSFLNLVNQKYFDDTECHRLTTYQELQMLQCGDPSATGSGGPGYQFGDEFPVDEVSAEEFPTYPYHRGYVAMANAGADTNGSQFFIVFGESELPPAYTIFGRVTAGLGLIDDIAERGVDGGSQDGPPAETVEIVTASAK